MISVPIGSRSEDVPGQAKVNIIFICLRIKDRSLE